MVKLWISPNRLPLKINPWVILLSKKVLSNDHISTGLSDGLYSSNNVVEIRPKRSRILSSWTKLIWLPIKSDLISTLEHRVDKVGLIVNGYLVFFKETFLKKK